MIYCGQYLLNRWFAPVCSSMPRHCPAPESNQGVDNPRHSFKRRERTDHIDFVMKKRMRLDDLASDEDQSPVSRSDQARKTSTSLSPTSNRATSLGSSAPPRAAADTGAKRGVAQHKSTPTPRSSLKLSVGGAGIAAAPSYRQADPPPTRVPSAPPRPTPTPHRLTRPAAAAARISAAAAPPAAAKKPPPIAAAAKKQPPIAGGGGGGGARRVPGPSPSLFWGKRPSAVGR